MALILERVILFIGIGWLVSLAGCGSDTPPLLETGKPTPRFSLHSLSNHTISFPDDLKNQVVAIRFWADWCPFCKSEMAAIEPVYKDLHSQGLEILAINVRQDQTTAMRFVQQLGVTYPALLDPDGEIARAYGVSGLPSTFFIDRQGRLVTRLLGEATPETFKEIVLPLLQTPTAPQHISQSQ